MSDEQSIRDELAAVIDKEGQTDEPGNPEA